MLFSKKPVRLSVASPVPACKPPMRVKPVEQQQQPTLQRKLKPLVRMHEIAIDSEQVATILTALNMMDDVERRGMVCDPHPFVAQYGRKKGKDVLALVKLLEGYEYGRDW